MTLESARISAVDARMYPFEDRWFARCGANMHYVDEGQGPPVVLLHGSPGSSRDFLALGPALAARHRVVAPDLPGFGASSHSVPDYSIRAHALYVLEMLETLGIERVHLLGFSMGGGVALEIYEQAPERVASLTLLSAIGVVELELLGNHRLNHAIHAAQLGAVLPAA